MSIPVPTAVTPYAAADSSDAQPQARSTSRPGVVVVWPLLVIIAVATVVRVWDIGAPFASSDQAAMPYFVRHGFGVKWLFAHSYGPAPAMLQRSFAQILCWLGLPIAETAARIPVTLLSVAQVALTYFLLRRMSCRPAHALLGTMTCAFLPALVSDGHYAWTYYTLWLFSGTLALWATLAYLDDRRPLQLATAALGLFIHCLSNCFAFALPLTLLVLWAVRLGKSAKTTGPGFCPSMRAAILGFALPCLAALLILGVSWCWTGEGQIGRLITKHHGGATGWQGTQAFAWWTVWVRQFGYLYVPIATAGAFYGAYLLLAGNRLGLLALWAWAGAIPLVAFTSPHAIGHPGPYLLEALFAAGVLGSVLLASGYELAAPTRAARLVIVGMGSLAVLHMAVGGVDACLTAGRLRPYTGVSTPWGQVSPDSGIKAAGWYVREHVPMDAVVLTLHSNRGMEVPVAEYYLGRMVLAGFDQKPEILPDLVAAVAPVADVVVAEPQDGAIVEGLEVFEQVCVLTRDGHPVRFIYARPGLALPKVRAEIGPLNVQYDARYCPRHVPIPLPAAMGFADKLKFYQETVHRLKAKHTLGNGGLLGSATPGLVTVRGSMTDSAGRR